MRFIQETAAGMFVVSTIGLIFIAIHFIIQWIASQPNVGFAVLIGIGISITVAIFRIVGVIALSFLER